MRPLVEQEVEVKPVALVAESVFFTVQLSPASSWALDVFHRQSKVSLFLDSLLL
jgi:hypothetical protein